MAANAVNYVYHLVMGRLLGPVDYGSLASIFSVLYMMTIIPISTSFAIVKFISSARDAKERAAIYHAVKKLLWQIGAAAFIIIVFLSPFVARFLYIPNVSTVALVGPIVFLSLITLVNQASMQGVLRFIGLVGPNLMSAASKLVLGVIFVLLGLSVTGAIGAIFLAVLMAYFLSVKLKGNLFAQKTDKEFNLKPFLKYALPVLLQALAFTAFFTVDVILVKHFLPSFQAGLYAALSTLGKIIFFASQPVTATMFPIVSGRKERGERYRKVFFLAFFLTVFISISIVIFYYLFPNIAIGLLYGSQYLAVKGELVWMGAFMAVYTASYFLVNFLLSIDKTKIAVLPLLAAIGQAIGIWVWHESILQVIQISLVAMVALFSVLSLYLGYNARRYTKYNRFQKRYARD